LVRHALTNCRSVGGNGNDGELVNSAQFTRGARRSASHPAHVRIEQEEILNRNPGCLPCFDGDFDSLLRFDGLVQTGAPLAPFGESTGELVDDDNFAVANEVLAVEEELALNLD